MLVSVLGLSPDFDSIIKLCDKYDVLLLEDNCESQGSMYNGKRLGNFGLMSSFSTYFGHTMSTIEGGMICTNDEKLYKLLIQLRSHGWDRDLDKNEQNILRDKWGGSSFDSLYTFYVPGFNLRSTDLQAFIGINQLNKIDESIAKRNENFYKYKELLYPDMWFPREVDNSFTANFAIPIIVDDPLKREYLYKELADNNIACRPLISGSMGTQPFYIERYGKLILPNCSIIDSRGLYVPNHPMLTDDDINRICNIILKYKK